MQEGAPFASATIVTARPNATGAPEIQHGALGGTGRPARLELAALFFYVLALAAFLVWLIGFGVNV